MKKNQIRTRSRRKTPWDGVPADELDSFEIFLRREYHEHYSVHHVSISETDEAQLLNSFEIRTCHLCGSTRIRKDGFAKSRLQRYYCNDCRQNFVITTGTIFDSHKLPISEWIEFCIDVFGYGSTSLTSKANKNSITTSNYWLNKLFLLLKDYSDSIIVKGKIQIDETYYRKRNDELKRTKEGKQFRGLSRNQEGIYTACDENGIVYARANGTGKPSQKRCWESLGTHIGSGSLMIHDKERAHRVLVRNLNLKEKVYDASRLKDLSDKRNPMNQINQVHNQMQKFLDSHPGFNREHLQDYINLFMFITNPPDDPLEKIRLILEMGLTKPISLRYRKLYQHK